MSTDSTVSASDVLALLDYEIAQITARDSQRGVTTWVLLGSLGTLLWASADEAQRVISQRNWPDNGRRIGFAVLVLSLVLGGGFLLYTAFRVPRGSSDVRFASTFAQFSDTRPAAVVSVCQLLTLLAITVLIAPFFTPSWWWRVVAWFPFIFASAQVAIVAVSYRDTLMTVRTTRQGATLALWVFPICGALTVLCGCSGAVLFLVANPFAFSEWRLAALFVGIGIVTLFLAARTTGQTTYDALLEIRRELGFAQIEPATAMSRAQVIVMGISLDQAVSEAVSSVMQTMSAMRREQEALLERINNVRDALLAKDTRDEIDTENVRVIMAAAVETGRRMKTEGAALGKEFGAARRRLDRIQSTDSSVKARKSEINVGLTAQLSDVLALSETLGKALDELRQVHERPGQRPS